MTSFTVGIEPGSQAHTDTASLTVTPTRTTNKALGVVQAMTVTPARTTNKSLGKNPKLTVTPARVVTTQGVHVMTASLVINPIRHATGFNPHVYPKAAQGGGSSMIKRAMLWADL